MPKTKFKKLLGFVIWLLGLTCAGAQSTVTTSGTTSSGTVPVFNGTATVTNSPITVSGSNVGIGTTAPYSHLEIVSQDNASGLSFFTGPYDPTKVWGTRIYKHDDGGGIPLYFDQQNSGTWATIFRLGVNGSDASNVETFGQTTLATAGGNVGIGTTNPQYTLDINGVLRAQGSGSVVSGNGGYIPAGLSFVDTSYSDSTHVNQWSIWKGNTWIQGLGFMRYSATNRCQAGGICNLDLMLYDSGDVAVGENNALTAKQGGNVGIGTTSPSQKLEVAGYIQVDSGVYFPGSSTPQTTPWTGVLCGGDYAEAVDAAGPRKAYEPGDVLIIADGPDGDVKKSTAPYATTVAGIYATKPGVVGRRESLPKDGDEVPMAMVGIVPTRVTAENGSIHKGDLLVTSSESGYAMKGTDRSRMLGAVIGKAMGSLESGSGVIEVLVTLQ